MIIEVVPAPAECPRCEGVGTVFGELSSWPCTFCYTAGICEFPTPRFDVLMPSKAFLDWFGFALTEHRPASKMRRRRRG